MAEIMHSDRMQMRANKAVLRRLERVEKHRRPPKISVRLPPENRVRYRRKPHRITPRSRLPLPSYDKPITDRQGRRGVVLMVDYDGAKRHAFGIIGRRIVYLSDPEHCELDAAGNVILLSNMGADLDEILAGADVLELGQRESRADAKTNVNLIVQLPHDVPQEVRRKMLQAIAHELFGRHGLPYTASLHRPDPNGDQRNFHGHICGGWRPMRRTAPYQWDIARDYRSDLDGPAYWRHARRRVSEIMTGIMQRAGQDRVFTHFSNAERGLVHKPQKKLDKRKTREAREGNFVADVEANRAVMQANIALADKLEKRRKERRARAVRRMLSVLKPVTIQRGELAGIAAVNPLKMSRRSSDILQKVRPAISISGLVSGLRKVEVPTKTLPITATIVPVRKNQFGRGAIGPVTHSQRSRAHRIILGKVHGLDDFHAGLKHLAAVDRVSPAFTKGIHSVQAAPSTIPALHSVEVPRNSRLSDFLSLVRSSPYSAPRLSKVDTKRTPSLAIERVRSAPTPAPKILPVATHQSSRLKLVAAIAPAQSVRAIQTVPTLQNSSARAALGVVQPVQPARVPGEKLSRYLTRVEQTAPSRALGISSVALPVGPPNIARVLSRSGWEGLRPVKAKTDAERINWLRHVRPVPTGRTPLIDPALIAKMEKLTALLAAEKEPFDHEMPLSEEQQREENWLEEIKAQPLSRRLSAFADSLDRRPSGLRIDADKSVHPTVALIHAWGLSESDLRTSEARKKLLPFYVEQELRLEQLETELCDKISNERELFDPSSFRKKLSPLAAEAADLYRGKLLDEAIERVRLAKFHGNDRVPRHVLMARAHLDWEEAEIRLKHWRKMRRERASAELSQHAAQRGGIA